jgi:hypothetical protein
MASSLGCVLYPQGMIHDIILPCCARETNVGARPPVIIDGPVSPVILAASLRGARINSSRAPARRASVGRIPNGRRLRQSRCRSSICLSHFDKGLFRHRRYQRIESLFRIGIVENIDIGTPVQKRIA